jgi:hypothetical protein
MDIKFIEKLTPCNDITEWFSKQKSFKQAWLNCERGDWMTWLLRLSCEQNSTKHKKIILTVCKCVRLSLKLVSPHEKKRLLSAIILMEKWAQNKATIEEVKGILDNVINISLYRDVECSFTNAAVSTIYLAITNNVHHRAAADAEGVITSVLFAFSSASNSSTFDHTSEIEVKILKKCAKIVREDFPHPPLISKLKQIKW